MAATDQDFKKLPVTVLSGFLGSGKTTLLKHILSGKHGLKIAVIVNDMASVNVDAFRVGTFVQTEEKMVEMHNGCICCTLREDLLIEVKKLVLEGKFDYLVIESTGISEPLPIAETFTFGLVDEEGQEMGNEEEGGEAGAEKQTATTTTATMESALSTSNEAETAEEQGAEHKHDGHEGHDHDHDHENLQILNDIARLDCMVTVMDVKQFLDYLNCNETLFDMWGTAEEATPEEERTVSYLLIEQVEFANVILLNKIDLVSKEELTKVDAMIKKLNPGAKIIHTKYSNVDLKEVVNTNLFDFDVASDHPGWLKELRGEHIPESDEYGISSFILNQYRPLHAQRFHDMLESLEFQQGIIRAKGVLWFHSMHDIQFSFDICGATVNLDSDNGWLADRPEDDWGVPEEAMPLIKKDFRDPYGDRRCEIVCIGDSMNEEQIRARFQQCLLTEEEYKLGPETWKLDDFPFGGPEDEEMEEGQEADKPEGEEISSPKRKSDASDDGARKKHKASDDDADVVMADN